MKLNVLNLDSDEIKEELELNKDIFEREIRLDILHRVVNWQLAKRRSGTHQVKNKGMVTASTRKIYSQKGSGRARHGSLKAVQFRGGGVVFGPISRSHEFKLNKKVRNLGLKIALSLKKQEGDLLIFKDFKMGDGKSSTLFKKLKSMSIDNALILGHKSDKSLSNASSNLYRVNFLPLEGLNVLDLLMKDCKLIMTIDSMKRLEERLGV